MKEFVIKCLVVTACVWFILFCYMPRFQTHHNNGQMLDVLTGKVYTWNGYRCH